ncbi:MAG: hypothetical protein HFK10_01940 [Clostridia bacterium]|nr:hypothetical protein [Clostridia bacterium]
MKNAFGIFVKLLAAVAFLGGIGGGGYCMYVGLADTLDLPQLLGGAALFIGGVFVVGCLVPQIAHRDGQADREKDEGRVTALVCLKVGLTAVFFAAFILFTFIGIVLWWQYGLWQLGVAAIGAFLCMLLIAVVWSIRWQMRGSRKARSDPNASETVGTVQSVAPQFTVLLFGKNCHLICRYTVDIDGTLTTGFLRKSDRLAKRLRPGSRIKIRFNPERPRYCAILATSDPESDA